MTDQAGTTSSAPEQGRAATWRFAALSLAVVAAVFSTAVGGVMVWVHVNDADNVWTNAAPMARLESQLAERPVDAALKEKIRQQDQESRAEFFRRQKELQMGGWLLLAGLAIFLAAAKCYAALRPKTVEVPTCAAPTRAEWLQRARREAWAVTAGGAALAVGLGGVVILGHERLPGVPQVAVLEEVAALPVAETWPMFRGPTARGIVTPGDWPQSWDTKTGENVLWKCAIPGEGNSSPVVWGERVFMTSADAEHRWLHCVDASAGKVLWSSEEKSPPGAPGPDQVKPPLDDTGYAAPTAATDGTRVYVTYANADVAAFDFAGKQLWVINLGVPQSSYGLASSPIIYKNLLILQHDQGGEAEDRLSSIVALDVRTGRIVWQTPRPVPGSWSSPILMRPDQANERLELVACGTPWVMAYDPASGRELWRAKCFSGDVAPSPVAAGGVVVAGVADLSDGSKSRLLAIRAGGAGDVTATNILWSTDDNVPKIASPVADGERGLAVGGDSHGVACYNTHTGKVLWAHDFENAAYTPSPVLADDMVYLPVEDGRTFVFRLVDKFELLHICKIEEQIVTSPAFAGGRIYIRGKNSLYCIGRRSGSAATASPATEGKK